MPNFNQTPRFILRLIHLPPRILYAVGLGPLFGRVVLLLKTIGCKSGKRRVTPLQYEYIDGMYYLGAALGLKSDWVRNIQANPKVELRVRSKRLSGTGEVISDVKIIADFLETRLQRHPRMIGAMLRAEGLKIPAQRIDLEQYARQLTLVRIKPD